MEIFLVLLCISIIAMLWIIGKIIRYFYRIVMDILFLLVSIGIVVVLGLISWGIACHIYRNCGG